MRTAHQCSPVASGHSRFACTELDSELLARLSASYGRVARRGERHGNVEPENIISLHAYGVAPRSATIGCTEVSKEEKKRGGDRKFIANAQRVVCHPKEESNQRGCIGYNVRRHWSETKHTVTD